MLLAQQFKTLAGAQKRAAFENAHCQGRYWYSPVRCRNGQPDDPATPMQPHVEYMWRLRRRSTHK